MRPLAFAIGLAVLASPLLAQTAAPPAAPAAAAPASGPDLKAIAALIAKGRLAPAERQLRDALARGAGANVRGFLGLVLMQEGKAAEAEKEMQQALRENPALSDLRQHLARLYLTTGREKEGTAELRRAAAAGRLDRDLALELARVEDKAGHAALAERQLRSAAEQDSVEALLQLARLDASRGDGPGATAALARARTLAPNAEDVLSASAQVSLGLRAPVPAILFLEPLARMCPTVAQYPYLLGVALMQAGDMLAAAEPLQQAEKLEPDRVLTLVALGLALNAGKMYGEAQPFLLRAAALEPDNVEAVAALAEAEDGLGEEKEAEGHAERALAQSSGHATANLVLGMVRMKQERYEEARDALAKSVAADPAAPKAYYQLSLAYARLGDEASAQKHVQLYQQKLREIEERVNKVRTATGLASGGGMIK